MTKSVWLQNVQYIYNTVSIEEDTYQVVDSGLMLDLGHSDPWEAIIHRITRQSRMLYLL